jgi:hypothetical protein
MSLIDDMLASSTANQQVMQYPDAKIYKAASQLKPEDRPTVPVVPIDPDPVKYPVYRHAKPGAFAGIAQTSEGVKAVGPIMVSKTSPEYNSNDPLQLASVIAHEAQHYKTGNAEEPAYNKAIEVLLHTRLRDSDYMKELQRIASKYKGK